VPYRHDSSGNVQPTADTHEAVRPGLSLINRSIHFVDGQHAGQTVRAELHEVQKADLGRKYARVDRRPLDPPPAVLLKLFRVYDAGTDRESEREFENYDDVQNLGILCNVDLFPVPSSSSKEIGWKKQSPLIPNHIPYTSPTTYAPNSSQRSFTFVSSNPFPSGSMSPVQQFQLPRQVIPGYFPPSDTAQDIVSEFGGYPITESSKVTSALVGATFVQPASVDYRGKKVLMFVFADLAVKIEGTFILRYRVFDIFSKAYGNSDLVVQAECYGGPFRIYSTKEFPGLQASTELTKQLARWGVRLNIRETERRRRRKGERRTPSPSRGTKRMGKQPTSDDSLDQGSDSDDD